MGDGRCRGDLTITDDGILSGDFEEKGDLTSGDLTVSVIL